MAREGKPVQAATRVDGMEASGGAGLLSRQPSLGKD